MKISVTQLTAPEWAALGQKTKEKFESVMVTDWASGKSIGYDGKDSEYHGAAIGRAPWYGDMVEDVAVLESLDVVNAQLAANGILESIIEKDERPEENIVEWATSKAHPKCLAHVLKKLYPEFVWARNRCGLS